MTLDEPSRPLNCSEQNTEHHFHGSKWERRKMCLSQSSMKKTIYASCSFSSLWNLYVLYLKSLIFSKESCYSSYMNKKCKSPFTAWENIMPIVCSWLEYYAALKNDAGLLCIEIQKDHQEILLYDKRKMQNRCATVYGGGIVIEHINLFFCKCTEYLWQETQ